MIGVNLFNVAYLLISHLNGTKSKTIDDNCNENIFNVN